MDIETLRAVGADLFGNGWQTRMARALGVDGSTVRRWLANGVEAPPYIAAYLDVLGDRQETRGALLFEQHATVQGVTFPEPAPITLEHMVKRLKFPGVDQLKPMPAIHLAFDARGDRVVRLDGAEGDALVDQATSIVMVRHPDARHLRGYVNAARSVGRSVAVATHRFHHYTLELREGGDEPFAMYLIATHAGEVRTTISAIADPGTEVMGGLSRMLDYP